MDQWSTIRSLNAEGMGIRGIARKLGIARGTVRNALREADPRFRKADRKDAFRKLLPHREAILSMLKQKLIGTRIFHEIQGAGYTGGHTALYHFIQELQKELPRPKATVRFETPPGLQAQFDWSPYRVVLGGALTRVVVYDLILSYSRRKFFWPSLVETQESVFEALEKGFVHFGGCARQLLVDNARVFVADSRPANFQWNSRFLEFCKHYGVAPRAAPVRRGQTKGKVERPFFYLEQHFIKGRTFTDFFDFSRKLFDFRDELDVRVHHSLRVTPMERFCEEREALLPLPSTPHFGTLLLFRKVSWDCLVAFEGSRYSVPFAYAGKEVSLKVSQGLFLEIFSGRGERIAMHRLSEKKHAVVIEERHYEGLKKQAPRTLQNLKRSFLEEFPEEGLFLEKFLAQYKWNGHQHLRVMLELVPLYPKEEICKAFSLGVTYNTFSSSFIRGILEAKSPVKVEPMPLSSMVSVPSIEVKQDLQEYQRFLLPEGGG